MKKKVLMCIPDLGICNGVTSFIMSFYDYLVQHDYVMDFLVVMNQNMEMMPYVCERGSNVFCVPIAAKYDKCRIDFIDNVLREGKYDIVHVNFPGPNGAMVLKAAKKWGVKNRIYHSHNPLNLLGLKAALSELTFTPICRRRANKYIACSVSAGKSIFGGLKFEVINNAINPEDFLFDAEARATIRKRLSIEKSLVIGVAARIEAQKNPEFIIEVFYEIKKRREDAVLLWVGGGSKQKQIEEQCVRKNILADVLLVGRQENMTEWYSAMDMFLLPSKYEGLGIAFLEAQANGLLCFGSKAVPKETEITELMHRISLGKDASDWAEEILQIYECREGQRDVDICAYKELGYDVRYSKDKLYTLYETFYNV